KSVLEMLQVKKEGIIIEEDKHLLVDFLDKFESGDFTGGDEMIKTYENLISKIYIRTLLKKRYDDKVNTSEFVLENEDSYDECLKLIEKNNDPKSKIKTGFQNFDKNILKGGLENGRIYIFGGTPGVGKSIALLNFLCGAAFNEENGDGLYFYFTLENFIGESLERTIRMLPYYDKASSGEVINGDAKNMFKYLEKSNKKIVMKYLLPYSSNINDAMIYMDEMISKTGLKAKMAVFDYLDLFASVNKTEMYRLELGHITMEQKMVGIKYGIPSLTATQLNSEGYNSKTPGLGSVTESRKKAEHADFIGLLQADMADNIIGNNLYNLTMHIKKNRNGPLGCANFNIDYSKMLIKESGISMFAKQNKSEDSIADFSNIDGISQYF
ncbi:hypothetical protein M0R36_11100, partial [bacterium]|nr:hypothetical protein [bacterium]